MKHFTEAKCEEKNKREKLLRIFLNGKFLFKSLKDDVNFFFVAVSHTDENKKQHLRFTFYFYFSSTSYFLSIIVKKCEKLYLSLNIAFVANDEKAPRNNRTPMNGL